MRTIIQATMAKLTREQERLIEVYRDKWRKLYLSTERINRPRLLDLLKKFFEAYPDRDSMPEILIFDSPYAAFNAELDIIDSYRDEIIYNRIIEPQFLRGECLVKTDLWFELELELGSWIQSQSLDREVWQSIEYRLTDRIASQIYELVWEYASKLFFENLPSRVQNSPDAYNGLYNNLIDTDSQWARYASLIDFCVRELGYEIDLYQCNLYKEMCRECGYWFMPSSYYYVVCDRPTKILLDERDRIHANDETAIEFVDGFCLFAKHGEITGSYIRNTGKTP